MAQKAIHINLAQGDEYNIQAENDAALLGAIFANSSTLKSGVLPWREKLQTEKISDNTVRMSSGIYCMQGFMIIVPDEEDFTIQSGVQNKKRIDLIVAEYKKGEDRDSYVLKVLTGEQADNVPQAPSLITQNLYLSGNTRQEEVVRITINSTSIESVDVTAPIITSLGEVSDNLKAIEDGTTTVGNADKLGGKEATDFATVADLAKLTGQLLPNGSDLNNISGTCTYQLNGGYTYSNLPSGVTWGILSQTEIGSFKTQIIYRQLKDIWIRFYANSNFEIWKNLNDADLLGGISARDYVNKSPVQISTLPLDQLWSLGSGVTVLSNVDGVPVEGQYFYVTTFVFGTLAGSSSQKQIFYSYYEKNDAYSRVKYSGSPWGAIERIGGVLYGTATPTSLGLGEIYIKHN